MDRIPNARIMELCRVKKGLDERIDEGLEGVLRWREKERSSNRAVQMDNTTSEDW